MNWNQLLCFNQIQSEMYTQLSTEYAFILAGDHYNQFSCILYHEKRYVILWRHYDVKFGKKKIGNIFFLKQHYVSSRK